MFISEIFTIEEFPSLEELVELDRMKKQQSDLLIDYVRSNMVSTQIIDFLIEEKVLKPDYTVKKKKFKFRSKKYFKPLKQSIINGDKSQQSIMANNNNQKINDQSFNRPFKFIDHFLNTFTEFSKQITHVLRKQKKIIWFSNHPTYHQKKQHPYNATCFPNPIFIIPKDKFPQRLNHQIILEVIKRQDITLREINVGTPITHNGVRININLIKKFISVSWVKLNDHSEGHILAKCYNLI